MGNTTLKINTWIKDDEEKEKNYFYKKTKPTFDVTTIKSVDLRNNAPEIYNKEFPPLNQLSNNNTDLMFATPNALVSICEYLNNKNGKNIGPLSRMFVYYNAKDNRGIFQQNIPVSFIDCIETIKSQGICTDSIWTYDIEKANFAPVIECYNEGKQNRQFSFYKLSQDEQTIKQCIVNGEPIMFGLNIYQNFLNIKNNTILELPKDWEQQLGEYATSCFGYDDSKRAFLCRGSFGPLWGEGGYFWISYDYVLSNKCMNFWTITLIA